MKEAGKKFKDAKTKVASHKEALKIMRKATGYAETSLHTRVEDVLKTYGISKESYHGGQLAGNACRILVERIGEIGAKLYQVIMEHHTSPTLTAATVKSKVEDFFKIFGLIDAAFASLMAIDPNLSELVTAEKSVGILMKECRRQQIPMTLKAHVMEHHVIETHRKLKGLGNKDESFVEKLHRYGWRVFLHLKRNTGASCCFLQLRTMGM
jgi:hypothetical protein